MRSALLVGVVAVTLGVAPRSTAGEVEDPPLGVGASQVWVLKPNGPTRSVVVFLHGWGTFSPEGTPWIDHLRARGNAVVFPRYQKDFNDRATSTIYRLRDGLRRAFAQRGLRNRPVVTVGVSWGASLAFQYGAQAQAWRVPGPSAVAALNPASQRFGGPPKRGLPRSVRVLLMVGDADRPWSAQTFWHWLGRHPRGRKTFRIVRSTATFRADHGSPTRSTPAARRAFWVPVDELIARARAPGR
jgi:pimeloyl-ACP methyl ester carboxylesterase